MAIHGEQILKKDASQKSTESLNSMKKLLYNTAYGFIILDFSTLRLCMNVEASVLIISYILTLYNTDCLHFETSTHTSS